MRILVVSRSTSGHPGSGGMERVYENLVSALGSEHDWSLLTTAGTRSPHLAEYAQIWEVEGGRAGRYSMAWWYQVSRPGPWTRWAPDLVLSASTSAGLLRPHSMRAAKTTKVICQIHGLALAEARSALGRRRPKDFLKAAVHLSRIPREIVTLRRADAVISIGPAVTSQLAAKPYARATQPIEISNGVAEEHFRFDPSARDEVRARLGIRSDEPCVAYVGRLSHQKGVDLLLQAVASSRTQWRVLVGGSGDASTELQALAVSLGIDDRAHFLGHQGSDGVAAILSAADVFGFPTRRVEGLPLNALEALAAGLPVATTRHAGLPGSYQRWVFAGTNFSENLAAALEASRHGERRALLDPVHTADHSIEMYRQVISELAREQS